MGEGGVAWCCVVLYVGGGEGRLCEWWLFGGAGVWGRREGEEMKMLGRVGDEVGKVGGRIGRALGGKGGGYGLGVDFGEGKG